MTGRNAKLGFGTFMLPVLAIPVGLAVLAAYSLQSAKPAAAPVAAPQAVVAATAPQAVEVEASQSGDPLDTGRPVCIVGFSKNLCPGNLSGGNWKVVECLDPQGNICTTLVGTDSLLRVTMRNNPDFCLSPITATCDEAPDVSGDFQAKLGFRIRLNGPCPVRGCWEGTWNLFDGGPLTIPIASGSIEGTLGVGTHRVPSPCLVPVGARCGDDCESCRNATFDPELNQWSIHVEGSIRGTVLQGKHAGCTVCVTMQGYFLAPADREGNPIPPDQTGSGWFFCGTADGVLECECLF